MKKTTTSSSGDDENVSAKLPASELEAAALNPPLASLLRTIPKIWAEFSADELSMLESRALFLLTAAGMVERRGWIRTTIANHPTSFELRFQATGEGGFYRAMQQATAIELQTWEEAWNEWKTGAAKSSSPFAVQEISPQEWRLTDQGEIARNVLRTDPTSVLDFVLKRGLYGPGYWFHRPLAGEPLSPADEQIIERHLAAGDDLHQIPRPPVSGSGQLLDIRKVDQPQSAHAVHVTNWTEGATALAEAIADKLVLLFDAAAMRSNLTPAAETDESLCRSSAEPTTNALPTAFTGGKLIFQADRVLLCGVDICSGPKCKSRRVVLELLARVRRDGTFVTYSGAKLRSEAELHEVTGDPGAWIRDLRSDIAKRLLAEANISVDPKEVILSCGPGYGLTACLSVQWDVSSITVMEDTANDRGHDRDDRGHDRVDQDPDRDESAGPRKAWILEELHNGRQLKTRDVMNKFGCSDKTARRALVALKDKIEFVGTTRSGHYRLRSPPTADG
jgi:hypothetical protein